MHPGLQIRIFRRRIWFDGQLQQRNGLGVRTQAGRKSLPGCLRCGIWGGIPVPAWHKTSLWLLLLSQRGELLYVDKTREGTLRLQTTPAEVICARTA